MLIKLTSGKSIEIFYMNSNQCDNYNWVKKVPHRPNLTEGYYYGDMIGPFQTEKEARIHVERL
jgi:hypothetical protein